MKHARPISARRRLPGPAQDLQLVIDIAVQMVSLYNALLGALEDTLGFKSGGT